VQAADITEVSRDIRNQAQIATLLERKFQI